MQKPTRLSMLLAVVAVISACSANPDPSVDPHDDAYNHVHQGLLGTLWVQTAGEYEALTMQAFRTATDHMKLALVDPDWTAALEQEGADFAGLPPAVIVDVDETVLDNSPYEARLVEDGERFADPTWNAWCREAAAEAVPGALDFAQQAAALNVTIFYVTNRETDVEEATRANLESAGFPIDPSLDTVLTKGENGWGSDKTSRRAEVAKSHRVLLLLGDDLNDFATGARADNPEERQALVTEHGEMWGRRWIVLPNPLYGSWDASVFGRDYDLSEAEKIERKKQHLKPLR